MKQFKNGPTYPPSEATSPMNWAIETGLPVFAKDKGFKGAKSYFACGYEHFCFQLYRNTKWYRHVYELLQWNKPTKIYFDFDAELNGEDIIEKRKDFVKSVTAFVSTASKHIQETFPDIGSLPSVYWLDASTQEKLSFHVIFEFFLESVKSVGEFANDCLKKCNCIYLDTKVYTKNRLFRLLYSYKKNKPKESALRIRGTKGPEKYNPQYVFMTLLQARIPSLNLDSPLVSKNGEFNHALKTFSYGVEKPDKEEEFLKTYMLSTPPGLEKLLSDFDASILSASENEHFYNFILKGKPCPFNSERRHKQNNTYFIISKASLQGWFKCADPDCPKAPYQFIDCGHVWSNILK